MADISDIQIIALRGASMIAPPNTLPAIRKGVEQGATATLLDVRATRDGVPVLAADVKLEKFSNGRGRVNKTVFEDIEKLDAGAWFHSEFAGTRIPSVQHALNELPDGHAVFLYLHDTIAREDYTNTLKTIAEKRIAAGGPVTYIVTDSNAVADIREWGVEGLEVIMMMSDRVDGWVLMQKAEKLKLNGIMPYRKQIDTVLVREATGNGLKVIAYFANAEDDMAELIATGVSGIVTCRPDLLKTCLKNPTA